MVSTSAYYQWAAGGTHQPGDQERDDARLIETIREIHADDDTVGVPRMTAELARQGWRVNHKRVARLMAVCGLAGYRPRRRVSTTVADAGDPPIPDLLGRLFCPDRTDVAWCGDLTYIPTDQGWLYLATVIDLASRRLIGYAMGARPDAQLMITALETAVATRGRSRMAGVIFHHDRGTQYMSHAFADACRRLGVTQSASRTGSCLDNAVAESFFATLKISLTHRSRYRTRTQARTSIFAWINRYNRRRLHSTLGYQPPIEWEQRHRTHGPAELPLAA